MMGKPVLMIAFAAFLVAGSSAGAFAETQWARNHPRRHEVNQRLNNQNRRIHEEVREGDMSNAQAANLHAQERAMRHEERLMAGQHGSHITRREKRALNRQENQVSKEIGK